VAQLPLPKVGQRPPCARVNQREDLLAHMRIFTRGDRQIRNECVEWSVDTAVIQVILGVLHLRVSRAPLGDQRIEREH
jgi:hypothetical protein